MSELVQAVLATSRKRFFRARSVFIADNGELQALEGRIGISMPPDIREWLLLAGYGDMDDELSIREEWFERIETGQLRGSALFALRINSETSMH